MKNRFPLFLLLFVAFFIQCKTKTVPAVTSMDDGKIEVIFLHINDVYEIAPLKGDNLGGMARIATIYKQLKKENPNTLFVHAGDFLSPSLMGTLKVNDIRIAGEQMVEVMNSAGVDVVAFGNHEFDIKEKDLQNRLNESEFDWIGTSVRQPAEDGFLPFHKMRNGKPEYMADNYIWAVKDADGTMAKIGLFSTTINSNQKDFVYYENVYRAAIEEHDLLKKETNLVLGLTHLELVQDQKLATMLQEVPLFMGGHDHDNMLVKEGNVNIAKADANGKTVYVHRVTLAPKTGICTIQSELIHINENIAEDAETQVVVNKWMAIQDREVKQIYPTPYEIIYTATTPLDGRESSMRNKPTNLGKLITKSMKKAAKNPVDGVFFNSGSVRLDDQLKGNIAAIDIFRTMPFGGGIQEVQMKGSLLQQILDEGKASKGKGAYLQIHDFAFDEATKTWLVQGKPLDENKVYWTVTNDYLMSKHNTDIKVLKADHKDILKIDKPTEKSDLRYDIRVAMIDFMKKMK